MPEKTNRSIVVFEDNEALSRDAADRFVALSRMTEQPFTVALTGGSSPGRLYELLTESPFREAVNWQNTHLFFGDDRAVAPDSPDSNYKLAYDTLISKIEIPAANVHRIKSELTDHDEAAEQYTDELILFFKLDADELPRFDLVLLGMGPDGHCASLFPHKKSLRVTDHLVIASEPGLAPFVPRITLTYPVLNNAANVLFMVTGNEKAEVVARILQGVPDHDTLPSQAVQPADGSLVWLLDRHAASRLS